MHYKFSVESENAADEMRQILADLPFEMSDVGRIKVELELSAEAQDRILPGRQAKLDEIDVPIEYGPVPESERRDNTFGEQGRHGNKGGKYYTGLYAPTEDAVRPDTIRAEILELVDGQWLTSREVAERIDHDLNAVAAQLSNCFNRHGYVKRRGSRPYEYTLDQDGASALEHGQLLVRSQE